MDDLDTSKRLPDGVIVIYGISTQEYRQLSADDDFVTRITDWLRSIPDDMDAETELSGHKCSFIHICQDKSQLIMVGKLANLIRND